MQVVTRAALALLVAGLLVPAAWAHGPRGSSGPTAADLGSPRFDYQPPAPGTYRLPAVKPAADGQVVDTTGTPRRLHELMGDRIVVLSFISTRCSDAHGCPLATAVLHQLREVAARDPVLARRLRLVTLSFDLAHDTPAILARFVPPAGNGKTWMAPWVAVVPTSEPELSSILEAYGQPVGPRVVEAPPTHLLRVYLIDTRRQIRNVYGLDFLDPRLLVNDARTLILEEQGRRP
jgi:cytochrome oxidase Cu insertion factor (SCO1/SenC/PrrC family)